MTDKRSGRPPHRLLASLVIVLGLSLAMAPAGAAASSSRAATSPAAPGAARPYSLNLAEPRDYVAQTNFVQCVGASMQMMLNIARPGADRTAGTQVRLQALARAWSGPRPDGFERQGASIRGWNAGLNILRAGPYRTTGFTSLQDALRGAALAIRETGRPVGLLVWRGRHAWVMSGFEATADPVRDPGFQVTRAFILDPLYPHGSNVWGPSPKPGTAISVAAVGRQFVQRSSRSSGPWASLPGNATLRGKYVVLLPYGPIRPGVE